MAKMRHCTTQHNMVHKYYSIYGHTKLVENAFQGTVLILGYKSLNLQVEWGGLFQNDIRFGTVCSWDNTDMLLL